jgi:hypothetical protein
MNKKYSAGFKAGMDDALSRINVVLQQESYANGYADAVNIVFNQAKERIKDQELLDLLCDYKDELLGY